MNVGQGADGRLTAGLSGVRLSVCMPLYDGKIDISLDDALCTSLAFCSRHGLMFTKHVIGGGSNIGITRESLMRSALRSSPTHVMFVDGDMAWDDPEMIARLIAADHDFVGVAGIHKTAGKPSFCVRLFPGVQTPHPRSGFLRVRDVGFGLVLLKRSVFDRMIAAYPKLRYDAADGPDDACSALFCETVQPDPATGRRLRLGEDIAFCWRWTAIGGEIHVDHNATLRHIGSFDYAGRLADILEPVREAAE